MQTFKEIPFQNYIVLLPLPTVTKVQPKKPVRVGPAVGPPKVQAKRISTINIGAIAGINIYVRPEGEGNVQVRVDDN